MEKERNVGEESKNSDQEHDDFLELHRTAIHDIAFFKLQQWRVTNYALLLYAAIVALPKFLPPPLSLVEAPLRWLLSFAVVALGGMVLCQLQKSIGKGRARLNKIREHFSKNALDAWAAGGKSSEDRPSLLWLFLSVLVVGFLLVTGLLYRSSC